MFGTSEPCSLSGLHGCRCHSPTKNDSAPVSADAVRTSTGALLEIPVCKVNHMKDAVFVAQSLGLKIIAGTEKTETRCTKLLLQNLVC